MDIEKIFDNTDDACEETVSQWVQDYLNEQVEELMNFYKTDLVEIWLVDVNEEKQTIGSYFILN